MHIGLIGLGRMGSNMRTRLREHDIEVTGFDRNPDVTDVPSIAELVKELPTPRIVWVMVPAGDITSSVIAELAEVLEKGDLIIDGGNSRFTEDIRHAEQVADKGIELDPRVTEARLAQERADVAAAVASAALVEQKRPWVARAFWRVLGRHPRSSRPPRRGN